MTHRWQELKYALLSRGNIRVLYDVFTINSLLLETNNNNNNNNLFIQRLTHRRLVYNGITQV